VEVRYEDIAQDGRLKVESLPHFMGVVCWRKLVAPLPGAQILREHTIVPILSRLLVVGGAGPFSVREDVTAHGGFEMAQTLPDARGETRLVLNLLANIDGVVGRTHGAPPENAGSIAHAGTVFAEHVFTRPFAAPDARKVKALPDGVYHEAYAEHAWVTGESLLALPTTATAIGPALAPDEHTTTFGIKHTDSNQHVNSLVYPQSFEEAVLGALARAGKGTQRLMTAFEIRYRKPCFVGDRVRWSLSLAEEGKRTFASGVLLPAEDAGAKPYCFIRAELT
jgi:hypothetical protein